MWSVIFALFWFRWRLWLDLPKPTAKSYICKLRTQRPWIRYIPKKEPGCCCLHS